MKKKYFFYLCFIFLHYLSTQGLKSEKNSFNTKQQNLSSSPGDENSQNPIENSLNNHDENTEDLKSHNTNQKKKHVFFIKKILLLGNQYLNLQDILKYFPSSPKERYYTPDMLNEILKSLNDTQWFSSLSLEIKNDVLYVTVKENKFLNEVIFQGYENTDDLQRIVRPILRPYQNVDEEQIQRAKKALLDFLQERGKLCSNIFVSSVPRHGGRIDIIFNIQEGDKTYIRDIQFVGNRHFTHRELMGLIKSRIAGFWRISFPAEEVYNAKRIDSVDTQNLIDFYKSRGFLDISIEVGAVLNQKKNGVHVTFTINEGMRYDFGTTNVISHVPGIDTEKVKKAISWKTGQCFNALLIKGLNEWFSNYLSSQGRPFINIIPEFKRQECLRGKNPKVNVILNIRQMPRMFVGNISLSGNRRTKDYVIHNMLAFSPGDPLSPQVMKRSYEQIQSSDFFNSAEILDTPTDFPDRRDITIKVKEKITCQPMIQAFYTGTGSQKDYGLMTQIADSNFLGRAWPAQLMMSIKRRGWDLGGNLVVPAIFNRQIDWNTKINLSSYKGYVASSKKKDDKKDENNNSSFYNNEEDNENNENNKKNDKNNINNSEPQYREYSAGLTSSFIFPLSPRFSEEIGISMAKSRTTVNPNASQFIQDNIQENPNLGIIGAIHRLNYNRRLSPKSFLSNWFASWRFSLMGGTVGYMSNSYTIGANAFFGPRKNYNLRLSATYGHLDTFGYMRFNNQFSLGDATFLGFEPSGVGPRDAKTKDALGGQKYYSAYARFYIPIDISESLPLKAVVFAQTGSLWDSMFDDEENVIGNDFVNRSSVGVGLSVTLPVVSGPIFIGWSKALQKTDYDAPSQFIFLMGNI